jgi:phage/plasmid-like protein (TIGR03299 family)
MAAGMEENDWMMSSNGIRPWHGIGTVIQESPTTQDAIRLAKLDWSVDKKPLAAQDGKKYYPTNFNGLVRSDNHFCLGVVKDKYEIVSNLDAFAFVDDIMANEKGAVKYETAGSLYGGKKVYLLTRMPDMDVLGDKIESYLFFTNSYDGISSVRAGISNVRVVCANTLQMAINGAVRSWSAPHTKTIKARQVEAIRALKLATTYIEQLPVIADKLAVKKVKADKIVPLLFQDDDKIKKDKDQKAILAILDIANNKPDLANFKGSAWGIYNAVADYISHPQSGKGFRSDDRKMDSFLLGNALLTKAQKIIMAA